jgi:hypothetical protein
MPSAEMNDITYLSTYRCDLFRVGACPLATLQLLAGIIIRKVTIMLLSVNLEV